MASLGNSQGEGHEGSPGKEYFSNTGYGTYTGAGNVKTGVEKEEGTGYDRHGNVKTQFGHWGVDYDPVTGAATGGKKDKYSGMGQDLSVSMAGEFPSESDPERPTDVSTKAGYPADRQRATQSDSEKKKDGGEDSNETLEEGQQ